eukprot:2253877-Lingulodinium_polyedra.AAC.1
MRTGLQAVVLRQLAARQAEELLPPITGAAHHEEIGGPRPRGCHRGPALVRGGAGRCTPNSLRPG